jgi:hypothetical protein
MNDASGEIVQRYGRPAAPGSADFLANQMPISAA